MKKMILATMALVAVTAFSTQSFAAKKMSQSAAKKACLEENSEMKGKALKKCIKAKRK